MNYQNKIAKDIRDASKNDPKIVWQIINRCSKKRKTDSDISLEALLFWSFAITLSISLAVIGASNISVLTSRLISLALGTLHIMLPIYTTIFNLVFDGGVIPESWSIGVINPRFLKVII
jgi:uncharacterized membrane protein